jgi:hypothetical protein
MHVTSPALYASTPIGDRWTIEGTLQLDTMSGASPLFYNTLSGASGVGVHDRRKAGDVRVTRYFDDAVVGVAGAYSTENDYVSRALSFDVRLPSADRNRTWAFGVGGSRDVINSENGVAVDQHRRTVDVLVGVTQVLSATSIVQSNVTWSDGEGYFSDPYKPLDVRPDRRRVLAWLTRLNQHLPSLDATVRLSYRYAHDSFGTDSNTVDAAWVQSLPGGWTVVPSLRYYTQAPADFYHDPPFGQGRQPGQPYSADTRLAAFGAWSPGIAIAKVLPDGWSADVKLEFYRQRSEWRPGGGSPGIEPFSARWITVGITRTF